MNRVLVFQIGSLGDTVVSIPAMRAARRHFESAERFDVLHETRPGDRVQPASVLEGNVDVTDFVAYPGGRGVLRQALAYAALWARLLARGYGTVVYLVPSSRTRTAAIRDRVFFLACGITRGVGFSRRPLAQAPSAGAGGAALLHQHEAALQLRHLASGGIEARPDDFTSLESRFLRVSPAASEEAAEWLACAGLTATSPMLVVCAGTNMMSKQWSSEEWHALLANLRARVPHRFVFVGSAAERQWLSRVAHDIDGCVIAAGELSVMGTAALTSHCAAAVGLDTGTMHLAGAVGVPCVSVFSERNQPGRWEPLGTGHQVFRNPVDCRGCELETCVVGGHPCMSRHDHAVIADAVVRALEGRAPSRSVLLLQGAEPVELNPSGSPQ